MSPASMFRRRLVPLLLAVSLAALPANVRADVREDALRRTSAADTCARWENPTQVPNRSPFATNHVAVFDPVGRRMIVCGGNGYLDASLQDVWICSLRSSPAWERVSGLDPWPSFINIGGAAAAFDSRRNRVLVFGGTGAVQSSEVWALSLEPTLRWSRLDAEGVAPSSRMEASAVYDAAGDRLVIFGGMTNGEAQPLTLNDTWALSLRGNPEWTELRPSGDLPSRRQAHTAIYDARRNQMVVFGGSPWSSEVSPDTNRVWLLSLGGTPAWASVPPTGPYPLARHSHAACYDPGHDDMIITGGFGIWDRYATGPLDAWRFALDRRQWSRIDAPEAPAGRIASTAVFDPKGDRTIVFGGDVGRQRMTDECWSLSLRRRPGWALISPDARPALPDPRSGGRGVYEPNSGLVVLALNNGETWTLSPHGAPTWRKILPADPSFPAQQSWSSLVADPARDRILAFDYVDLWALHLGPHATWEKLPRVGEPPPPRGFPSLVLDPIGDRLLMYGGYVSIFWGEMFRYLDDLWSLDLSAPLHWKRLEIQGLHPPPMGQHAGVYDSRRRRMVISGQPGDLSRWPPAPSQAWALSLDGTPVWAPLDTTGAAGLRNGSFAVYDPIRDQVLGLDGVPYARSLVALSLADNRVRPVSPAGVPLEDTSWPRLLAFDTASDRLVIFGPGMLSHELRQDLMFVQFSSCDGRGTHLGPRGMKGAADVGSGGPRISWAGSRVHSGSHGLALTLESASDATVEAYDIAGRRVWSEVVAHPTAGRTVTALTLPASLAQGVYWVRAMQGSGSATTRVVIIK